jgi:hypothetical protein
MYLTSIEIENLGPISNLSFKPLVDGENPKPLVIVGTNGSGKTTILSTLVSSLVAFKQQAFENVEVEAKKVFRMRGSRFLQTGKNFYTWQLEFGAELKVIEWVLNQTREEFEKSDAPKPKADGWKQIPAVENTGFFVMPEEQSAVGGGVVLSPTMQRRFRENVVLYFPSDRFEPPDWLNAGSVRSDLTFANPTRMQGSTSRNIFAKSLLKPTLEWLRGVILDRFLSEYALTTLPVAFQGGNSIPFPAYVSQMGPNAKMVMAVANILECILALPTGSLQFRLGNRTAPSLGIEAAVPGGVFEIADLLSLSAGQSALFCLFCAILRDADLASGGNVQIESIKGIVVIDEADLHLHLELQNRALPKLMRLFPKVQFLLTAHSPMLVMGIAKEYGELGFSLIEMPNGTPIDCERYSEFDSAFRTFAETIRFKEEVIGRIRSVLKPVLIVEGESDRVILEAAWKHIRKSQEQPFEVCSCGESRKWKSGGAKTLYALLEAIALYEDRVVLGLFDNDGEGAAQWNSLKNKSFSAQGDYLLGHQKGKVFAMILEPPQSRSLFAPASIADRLLEIEHFFSDVILQKFDASEDALYGSPVFRIRRAGKARIAEGIASIEAGDFKDFEPLLERIEGVLKPKSSGT